MNRIAYRAKITRRSERMQRLSEITGRDKKRIEEAKWSPIWNAFQETFKIKPSAQQQQQIKSMFPNAEYHSPSNIENWH
jgi:hypothetical protein